ncbi:hypothetical protein ABW21_db0203113 [Orbilia brochopaga]|nr:hypothetical protein ABW21_db0203113 [Drechslerella brochopaga]
MAVRLCVRTYVSPFPTLYSARRISSNRVYKRVHLRQDAVGGLLYIPITSVFHLSTRREPVDIPPLQRPTTYVYSDPTIRIFRPRATAMRLDTGSLNRSREALAQCISAI